MLIGVGILGFLIVTVVAAIARRRWARIAGQPVSDENCVACNSSSLTIVNPGMYVCNECGYEGGSLRADYERAQIHEQHASLPESQRRHIVTEHVHTAARMLSNYDADTVAQNLVVDSFRFRGGDEGFEEAARSVSMHLNEAVAELRRASTIAGGHVVLSNGLPLDATRIANELEAAQDSLVGAIRMRTAASTAHKELQARLTAVQS